MKPTVGRLVHFFLNESSHPEAALIVGLDRLKCQPSLLVFSEHGGQHFYQAVPNRADMDVARGAFWDWPAREEDEAILRTPIANFDGTEPRAPYDGDQLREAHQPIEPARGDVIGSIGHVHVHEESDFTKVGGPVPPWHNSPDPNDRPVA